MPHRQASAELEQRLPIPVVQFVENGPSRRRSEGLNTSLTRQMIGKRWRLKRAAPTGGRASPCVRRPGIRSFLRRSGGGKVRATGSGPSERQSASLAFSRFVGVDTHCHTPCVAPRRYRIVLADRHTGVYRRFSIDLKPVICAALALFALPVLVGLGLRWSARAEIAQLQTSSGGSGGREPQLPCGNRGVRGAVGVPAGRSHAARRGLDTGPKRAARNRTAPCHREVACGRWSSPSARDSAPAVCSFPGFSVPEDTFGVLRDLLYSLEGRLRTVQAGVARRQALAAATPTIWPAQGWLTDAFGRRIDPLTGEDAFHSRPRHLRRARAARLCHGRRCRADRGTRGRLRKYDHSRSRLRPGHAVRAPARLQGGARGHGPPRRHVGFVGSTGRSTGDHVHYEVLANGQTLNPLRFLLERAR